MFKIGDEVRLVRGWTRMVVIGFASNGHVIAKYDTDSYSSENRVTDWNFKNPHDSYNTQQRDPSGFVYWDGAPATKVYYTMPAKKYIVTVPGERLVGEIGTYLVTTQQGQIILQMDSDQEVFIFNSDECIPYTKPVPMTFAVKSVGSNYRCHYEVPTNIVSSIKKGNVLVSDSGNMYMVTEMDTKAKRNKGPFKGTRLITAAL